jgi:ketosteroid isomerase-like protein
MIQRSKTFPPGLARARPDPGYEAVWDFFVEAQDAWEESLFEYGDLIEAGNDKVVAHMRREARGKASGATVAWSYWLVVTFRDGEVLRHEWFADRSEALDAVGLRE